MRKVGPQRASHLHRADARLLAKRSGPLPRQPRPRRGPARNAVAYLVHAVLLHAELPAVTVRGFWSRFKLLLLQALVFLKNILSQLVYAGRGGETQPQLRGRAAGPRGPFPPRPQSLPSPGSGLRSSASRPIWSAELRATLTGKKELICAGPVSHPKSKSGRAKT